MSDIEQAADDELVGDLPPSRYGSSASLGNKARPPPGQRAGGSRPDLSKSKSGSQASLQSNKKSPSRQSLTPQKVPAKMAVETATEAVTLATTANSASSSPTKSIRRNSAQSSVSNPVSSWSVDQEPVPIDDNDRGRVKVFVRIRPMSEAESKAGEESVLKVSANEVSFADAKKETSYQFDQVFGQDIGHQEIFHKIGKPVVHSVLKGFNGTLMAYGQTGTGKTHTLTSSDGIIPRLVTYLFRRITNDQYFDYKVRCSSIQIYNERIYDLLLSEKKQRKQSGSSNVAGLSADAELNLREDPERGVFVENSTEYVVRSPKEVFELVKIARSRLVFAETKMNRSSSRSHAITFLSIERTSKKQTAVFSNNDEEELEVPAAEDSVSEDYSTVFAGDNPEDDTHDEEELLSPVSDAVGLDDYVLRGRITLCDLAGSERIKKTLASGDRLNEAQQINLSLLELGNVIHALTDKKRLHVPFRNSTLTRLLTESLGGNCLTRLIVCAGPCGKDLSETKGTLLFGTRAMRIKNDARVNMEVDYQKVAENLERQLREQEEKWNAREKALLREVEERTQKAMSTERDENARILAELQEFKLNDRQNHVIQEDLTVQNQQFARMFDTMSNWMSLNDAKIWISVQAALYNLEQAIVNSEQRTTFSKAVKTQLGIVHEYTHFIPKALAMLIEWLNELNQFGESPVVMEKWLSALPTILSSLNGNLMHHIDSISVLRGDSAELAASLKHLLHGSQTTDGAPKNSISSIHELLSSAKGSSPLHFAATIPLILQYQMADRLSFCTYALLLQITRNQEKLTKGVSTSTRMGISREIQTDIREQDIEDILDRNADMKAAACRVGNKNCSIM